MDLDIRKGFGTSLLVLLLSVPSLARFAHPKDTLPDGKKEPFAPFLGEFSVFTEAMGGGSLSVGFTVWNGAPAEQRCTVTTPSTPKPLIFLKTGLIITRPSGSYPFPKGSSMAPQGRITIP